MLDRLDHVGIAVEDLDGALSFYERTFKITAAHRELLADHQIEVALLDLGGSHVELLQPLRAGSAVGRFLEKHGPGLHHVAYRVEDIVATLTELSEAGVELVDPVPRRGVRDTKIAFLHPRSVGGVLTEIVEYGDDH